MKTSSVTSANSAVRLLCLMCYNGFQFLNFFLLCAAQETFNVELLESTTVQHSHVFTG